MLTITHIADTHLGHRQYGLNQREDDMASTLQDALAEMVTQHNTDAIVLPGDLFHSRDLRPKVLYQAEQQLRRVPDDVPVLVSRGNHDENLTPREVTWLNYLHGRGHIVFLKADLSADPDTARFGPYNPDNPGSNAGFYDIQSKAFDGPVRVFGLQWRGAKTARALEQVANGIRTTNEMHGEPAFTMLLAHFGMEDEVPSLGGSVTHADLREVKEVVDYLALGHVHKRYEAGGWIYNPGSPEAHNTREGRDWSAQGEHDEQAGKEDKQWEHGYYSIELSPAGNYDSQNTVGFDIAHHETKRRPYYRIGFDVTPYDSPGELETAFHEQLENEGDAVREHCQQPKYTAQDELRRSILDLRFTGTLQFSRGDFRTDELVAYAKEACDALYVQENAAGMRTSDVQQLISELNEEDVFKHGRLNTALLEDQVFETIAKESMYAGQAGDVADVLGDVHAMAQGGEAVEDIRDVVSSARRTLFPDLAENVVVDIDESPFDEEELDQTAEGERFTDESGPEEVTTQ